MLAFLAIIFVISFLFYYWQKITFNYWNCHGIPQVDLNFPSGIVQTDRTWIYSSAEPYKKYKGKFKYVGTYNIVKPILLVIDEETIKQILIKDFNYLQSRGYYHNEADDPMSAHLFAVDNPKWRALRRKVTPIFTSGKIKTMFHIVDEIAQRFSTVLTEKVKNDGKNLNMRDMVSKFTTDVIGNCAFGIDCNSLNEPNSQFRHFGIKLFSKPRNGVLKQFLMIGWPNVARKLHLKQIHDDAAAFFTKISNENVQYRLKNNIKRGDFVDLLLELRNEKKTNSIDHSHMEGLSLDEIAAQSFVFFVAGFETSSTAQTFTLYELAKDQAVQDKLRAHIRDVLKKHNDKLSYDTLNEMLYLEQCINESLRIYPPLPMLTRKTTEAYKLPGTNVVLPAGTFLTIPTYAIHHDPNNYPDPEKFDPDRFSPEESLKRHPFSFLPFGEGPRNCIGERFGMMQTKIGLAYLIKNFRFKVNPETKPLKFIKKAIVTIPVDPICFDVEKVE